MQVVGKATEVVTDPGKAVTDIATAPLKAAGDQVMQGVTQWVANGAAWLVGQAGKLIDATTTPRLDSPWFSRQYKAMAALAAVFALPLLLLSVLQVLGDVLLRQTKRVGELLRRRRAAGELLHQAEAHHLTEHGQALSHL